MPATVTPLVPRQRDQVPPRPHDVVLTLQGDLGFAGSARLRLLLDDLVGVGYDRVVLDVHDVPALDPTVLAIVKAARRRLARRGTQVLLQGLPG